MATQEELDRMLGGAAPLSPAQLPAPTSPLDAARARAAKLGLKIDPAYTPATADVSSLRDLQQMSAGQEALSYPPVALPPPAPTAAPAPAVGGVAPPYAQPLRVPTGAAQGQPPTPQTPPMPSELPTVSEVTESQKTQGVDLGEASAVGQSFTKMQEAARTVQDIKSKVDPETATKFQRYLAANISVEDALNPTGAGAEKFFQDIKKIRGNIDKANEDLVKFQEEAKVDPERYLKNMPAAERFASTLSIFLEDLAMAKSAGKGVAAPPIGLLQEQLNRAIDRDIAFQKEELASKGNAKVSAVNRYKENLALLGSERAAEIKTKMDYIGATLAVYESMIKEKQGKIDMAMAEEALAKQRYDYELEKAKLASETVKTVTEKKPMFPKVGMTEEQKREFDVAQTLGSELLSRTKEADEDDQKATMMERRLTLAESGDSGAISQLFGMFVREGAGPGAMTESDLARFGYDKSWLEQIKSAVAGRTGQMPEHAVKSIRNLIGIMKEQSEQVIAEKTADALSKAESAKLNPDRLKQIVPIHYMEKYQNYSTKNRSKEGKELGKN